jgi:MutS-like protein
MPEDTYRIRKAERQTTFDALSRRHAQLANLRLTLALMFAVMAWLSLSRHLFSARWLFLPVAAFAVVAIFHARMLSARDRARRAIRFYDRGLARLEDRWAGTGSPGTAYLPAEHLYAADLDLFGAGSLFELLSQARLTAGERTLADWLLTAAPPVEVRARQKAVDELRPRLDLRERLAVVGEEVAKWVDTKQLADWGRTPPALTSAAARAILIVLAGVNAFTLLGALTSDCWPGWFALSGMASVAFSFWWRKDVSRVLAGANAPAHQLQLLAEVLAVIEAEPVTSPRLVALQAHLSATGAPASKRIRQLRLLVSLLESRNNQFFAPLAAVLLWGSQCAWAIEAWRRVNGPALQGWISAAGEFEALASIAGYAFERPADVFPELTDSGRAFEGEALAHPLIPASRVVANDVRLDDATRVLVISGSNMSGKSTLLRTVGIAAVLAQCGAPVRARRLRLSPLALGATLRVQDSLQEGRSRFFAEITRLRGIVDLTAGATPVLFLLDELLAGTNSHDRRVGAASVVKGLASRGAIGLLTTHDLALADLASELGVGAQNVHFSDTFENGEMHFDYTMRPGVVRTTNALELMKAVGLLSERDV